MKLLYNTLLTVFWTATVLCDSDEYVEPEPTSAEMLEYMFFGAEERSLVKPEERRSESPEERISESPEEPSLGSPEVYEAVDRYSKINEKTAILYPTTRTVVYSNNETDYSTNGTDYYIDVTNSTVLDFNSTIATNSSEVPETNSTLIEEVIEKDEEMLRQKSMFKGAASSFPIISLIVALITLIFI